MDDVGYNREDFVTQKDVTKWTKFGDHAIEELILFGPNKLSIDIKNQTGLIKLVISESLYQNFVYGEIKFLDFSNLTDKLELNGQDYLQVSFTTPGFSGKMIKRKFFITNYNKLQIASTGSGKEVTLGFISEDAYFSSQQKVSGCYKGPISEIVSKIHSDQFSHSKLKTLTATKNIHSFIIPQWSPYKALNWLAKRSVADYNVNDSSFLFYEDFDGCHFTTLHALSCRNPVATYNYHDPNILSREDTMEEKLVRQFRNIQDLTINRHFDKIKEIDNGVYASQLISLDLVTKQWEYTKFDYLEHFDKTCSVEDHPLIPSESNFNVNKNSNAGFNFVGTHTRSHNGVDDNFKYSDFILNRKSSILRARSTSFTITVSGDCDRRVGDVVTIDIPRLEPTDDTFADVKDRSLSGQYLITGLQHVINKEDGYTTRLELSRDSLPFELMNAQD